MASVPNASPQLSTAGFAIDPLGIGSNVGCGAFKSASIADAQGQCLREYCAFLNKKLASVARDPAITPASGLSGNGAYVHSSVLCRAGANGCEDALLGVANLKGTLLNQGAACVRTPHADTSRADMWQLDLTPGAPPKAFAAVARIDACHRSDVGVARSSEFPSVFFCHRQCGKR